MAPCSSSSSKDIAPYISKHVPRVLWIPKFRTVFTKSPPLVHILSHWNPVKPLLFHSRNILSNTVLRLRFGLRCCHIFVVVSYQHFVCVYFCRRIQVISLPMTCIYIRMSGTYAPIYYIRVWNQGFLMTGHVVMPRYENARENTNTLIWRDVIFWNRIKFRSYPVMVPVLCSCTWRVYVRLRASLSVFRVCLLPLLPPYERGLGYTSR